MLVFLFLDSYTTLVNKLGLLAESDFEMSQSQEDGQSQASVSTVTPTGRIPKNCLRKDIHMSGSSSNDEESEDRRSQHSPRQDQRVEQDSPQQSLAGHSGVSQRDLAEKRLKVPPEPRFTETTGQEGRTLYP